MLYDIVSRNGTDAVADPRLRVFNGDLKVDLDASFPVWRSMRLIIMMIGVCVR